MKGFIEVTDIDLGFKILFPIGKVTAVISDDDGVYVEFGTDKNGKPLGNFVSESYDEIKRQIKENEV